VHHVWENRKKISSNEGAGAEQSHHSERRGEEVYLHLYTQGGKHPRAQKGGAGIQNCAKDSDSIVPLQWSPKQGNEEEVE